MPNISKEQFESEYAEKSGMTVEALRDLGLYPVPCDCGEDMCRGWAMRHKDQL